MKKTLYLLTIQVILSFCVHCVSGQSPEVIEKYKTGSINWTKRMIVSKGVFRTTLKKKSLTDDEKNQLFKQAKIVAAKNLFITMGKMAISSGKNVETYISLQSDLIKQIQMMVNNAQLIKKECTGSNAGEITLQITIDGGLAQLVLPVEIIQIEPVKTLHQTLPEKQNTRPAPKTGLVVDARGIKLKPVMSPRIMDENGKEVYGPGFVSREYAVQHGTVQYVKSFLENPRIGKNPILVTGLKTLSKNDSDLVISTADASKLHSSSENLELLHRGRVIIIINTPGF